MITANSYSELETISDVLTAPMSSRSDPFISSASLEIAEVNGAHRLFVKGAGIDIIGKFLNNKGYFSSTELGGRTR